MLVDDKTEKSYRKTTESRMTDKIIAIEEENGPFQTVFQRIMRLIPERDKNDIKLQRLIAFRLKIDGEGPTHEYLIRKIKEVIHCGYTGGLYDFLKDDLEEKACGLTEETPPDPPEVA